MIIPPPLRAGARVALVAPSSPQPPGRLAAALESVRAWGLEPVAYPSCCEEHGYLAGRDELRAADINAAFADDSIEGIICIRGGYGAHRLIPLLDFETILAHPKRFFGYSDVTALHTQLNRRCGMVCWHTPMPGTEWYKGLDSYTKEALGRALFGGVQAPVENPAGMALETLVPGRAAGRLTGGNLSLVAATLGTPYEIDTRDKILFLEDVGEEPYNLDRMLVQLGHAGKLAQAAGILLGPFTNCVGKKEKKTLPVETVLAELVTPAGTPVLANFQCGHVLPSACLPLGALARMDAGAQSFEITGV